MMRRFCLFNLKRPETDNTKTKLIADRFPLSRVLSYCPHLCYWLIQQIIKWSLCSCEMWDFPSFLFNIPTISPLEFFFGFHQQTTKVIITFSPRTDNGYSVYLNLENQNVKLDSGPGVANTGLVCFESQKPWTNLLKLLRYSAEVFW